MKIYWRSDHLLSYIYDDAVTCFSTVSHWYALINIVIICFTLLKIKPVLFQNTKNCSGSKKNRRKIYILILKGNFILCPIDCYRFNFLVWIFQNLFSLHMVIILSVLKGIIDFRWSRAGGFHSWLSLNPNNVKDALMYFLHTVWLLLQKVISRCG